jgi:hypothetical protein
MTPFSRRATAPSVSLILFSLLLILFYADISSDFPYVWGVPLNKVFLDLPQITKPLGKLLIGIIAFIGVLKISLGNKSSNSGYKIDKFILLYGLSTFFGIVVGIIRGVDLNYIIGDSQNIIVYFALFAIKDIKTDKGLKYLQTLIVISIGFILIKLSVSLVSDVMMLRPISWRYYFKGSPYLSPLLLIALVKLIDNNSGYAKFKWLLVVIGASAGIFLANANGILLGTFVGLISIGLFYRDRTIIVKLLLFGVLVGSVNTILALILYNDISIAFGDWFSSSSIAGFNYRSMQVVSLLNMFFDNPIAGNGLGSYDPNWVGYRDWLPRPYLVELELINSMAKLGVIGFGLLVFSFYLLISRCIRIAKYSIHPQYRNLITGMAAGLISLLMQSTVQTLYSSVMFHLYVVSLLLVLGGVNKMGTVSKIK